MGEHTIFFSSSSSSDAGSFRLVEFPPELCTLIETAIDENASLAIKGSSVDDAVLCTKDKTYALRSVVLSNTMLVVTPADIAGGLVVRDELHEVVELAPCVPRLQKLSGLLRGKEYDEGDEDKETERLAKRTKYCYDDARKDIQASDAELNRGLKERRILNINGELRPIALAHLNTIVELLLNYMVSLGLPRKQASAEELVSALADDHEIPRQVSIQVMGWFGDLKEEKWTLDVDSAVKEIGLGILRNHKNDPIPESELMARWKKAAGESFESAIQLALLAGNFLAAPGFADSEDKDLLFFSSSSLPVEPAARFSDLFATRPRWKGEDITPFLSDIAINPKERDKLLLKYARTVIDSQGTWYTARSNYS